MGRKSRREWWSKLFYLLFGDISFKPPPWWTTLIEEGPDQAELLVVRILTWLKANRELLGKGFLAILLLLAAYFGLKSWLADDKNIVKINTNIVSPPLTPMVKGAKPKPVHIDFDKSAVKLEDSGSSVKQGIAMSPFHKGTWTWTSDRRLTFTPVEDWPVGREFEIRMNRSLFPDHVLLDRYELKFNTPEFRMTLKGAEFHQDPTNPKIKKIVATLAFTHPVDPRSLEERVSLEKEGHKKKIFGFSFGDKPFPHTITYNELMSEAYIHSDPVKIPMKDSFMTVRIDAGVASSRGGADYGGTVEKKVAIPGMYTYFRVGTAHTAIVRNDRHEPEHVFVLTMTARAHEDEIRKSLRVHLLPRCLPPIPGRNKKRDCHHRWNDLKLIGSEVMREARLLKLEPLPTEFEFSKTHSFKFKAPQGRSLHVSLKRGMKSFGGYVLAKPYETTSRVPNYPKELDIMMDGSILSTAGEKKLTVLSRGLNGLCFEVGRVRPGQINHLISQSRGNFQNPRFHNYNFGPDNITDRFETKRPLDNRDPAKTQYTGLDLAQYMTPAGGGRRGLFFVKADEYHPEYHPPSCSGLQDKRMVLVTDMGLLVKEDRYGGRKVFVQSISKGKPVAGARVEVIGKNGVAVASKTTGPDGSADFPHLYGLVREKTPTAIVARHGQDLSFIPFNWSDRRLNVSRFDIGGIRTGQDPGKLKAYLFSDRGIYRPGDEIRVGMIIKNLDWARNLRGVPLELSVLDPRNLEVKSKRIRLSQAGFEEVRHTTEETSPTGGYRFNLHIVRHGHRAELLGTLVARVEEFLPDKMKITTGFSTERKDGWVHPKGLKAFVTLRNLFGTPAVDRRAAARIALTPASPSFRKFPEFVFFNPNKKKKSFSERLEDAKTDEDGHAEFDLELGRFTNAVYRLDFLAEGYEAGGGRAVNSQSSIMISDLPHLIGYKPDGNLDYVSRGSSRSVRVIAVGPDLKEAAVDGLRTRLYERRHVSVLKKQKNGTYKYQSVIKEVLLSTGSFRIPKTGLDYGLPTGDPGDYVLALREGKDENEDDLLRVYYTVVGRANITRSLEKNAELQVRLLKPDWGPGQEIEMQIVAPYTGAGLITIERDKVYARKWFKTTKTSSVQRIRVPKELEGNAYVHVSFVRALDSPEVFMSPLSYAVVPFTISRDKRTREVELETAGISLPGEPYKVRYKTDKPAKIVVFAVDEGILQVAKYKTPDPLSKFFEKRALEVRTSQILDLILPEFGLVKSLYSPGGGGFEAIGKNLNPFKRKRHKPVAYWSGIMEAGPGWREVVFDMPDYFNGTVRVMAVAVSQDAVGVAEKKGLVRGPFVLSPSVPMFVAPDDVFEVNVSVHNNAAGSGPDAEVLVELKNSKHLKTADGLRRRMKIPEGREGLAKFKLKALKALGGAELRFSASWGKKRSHITEGISVRPPIPYRTTVSGGHLQRDIVRVQTSRRMYPSYRRLEATASTVPLALARGLLAYLVRFPHGCTEQLVSRAFPALILSKRPEFGYSPRKVGENLDTAVGILRSRQNATGAFGFWTANSHVSPFQAAYAMHFLTEAKESGYPVPERLFKKGKNYLRYLASRSGGPRHEARARAYAIYVLVRNGEVMTRQADELLDYLKDGRGGWKKGLIGIHLAASYKMLKLDKKAADLIRRCELGDPQEADYRYFYDGLLRDSNLLYVLAKHFPDRLKRVKGSEIERILEPVSRGGFNTVTAASLILALDAYAGAAGTPSERMFSIIEENGHERAALPIPAGAFPKIEFRPYATALRLRNRDKLTVFYQATQAGFDLQPPEKPIKKKLEIQREYRDMDGNRIDRTDLGSEVEVRLRLRSLDESHHANVAVVDLLPGGFEVVLDPAAAPRGNVRVAREGSTWKPGYADVREDRVVLYGSFTPKVTEFVYRIRAVNRGRYSVPPPFGASMYDRSVETRGVGDFIGIGAPM